jgi:hypothetical protein
MSAVTLDDRSPVADDVCRWRHQQLERAGYPALDALMLSSCRDVDLHVAISLLASGCPLGTALQILL